MPVEQIQYVALDRIKIKPQVRRHICQDAVATMCRALLEVGQLQPIRVRRDTDEPEFGQSPSSTVGEMYVVTDGELRCRGAMMAKWREIAVIIEEKELCEGAVIQQQLIANCARTDLRPIDLAKAIEDLMKATGWSARLVAEHLGFSDAKVSGLLSLLSLSPEIQAQVSSGDVPLSSAYEIARVKDPEQKAELASQVAEGKLTRDALSGKIKATKRQSGTPAQTTVSRVTARLAGDKSITVSAAGLTLETFISVIEELLAKVRTSRSRGHSLATTMTTLADEAKRAS